MTESDRLTAEQVQEAIERHFGKVAVLDDGGPVEWRDDWVCKVGIDYKGIADELNAMLGGECECVWNEQEGTFHCSSCDTLLTNEISIEWPSHKVMPITLPNYCPNCGKAVKR